MTTQEGANVQGIDYNNDAINQLIHKRTDCGFPGIPKFQCVAIRGCCWDETIYDPAVKIPQCYKPIDLIRLNAKIVDAPANCVRLLELQLQLLPPAQLYYEREASDYGIDMFKYDGTAEDSNSTCQTPRTAC